MYSTRIKMHECIEVLHSLRQQTSTTEEKNMLSLCLKTLHIAPAHTNVYIHVLNSISLKYILLKIKQFVNKITGLEPQK